MANTYNSLQFCYDTLNNFKEEVSNNFESIAKYIFIGNSNPYANNDNDIPIYKNCPRDEKLAWDNMFAAKQITTLDVQTVLPRKQWIPNIVYKQYDDIIDLNDLVSDEINVKSMFVVSNTFNVYKCLDNNNGNPSTIEPTGDYNTSNGFIFTDDNYVWKYMYNVKEYNKYLTYEWIPVPSSINELEYNTNENNIINGTLNKVIITNPGSGYYDTIVTAYRFEQNQSIIRLVHLEGVEKDMSISADQLFVGTYIKDIDPSSNTVILSLPSRSNSITDVPVRVSTRFVINGDGNNDFVVEAESSNTINRVKTFSIGTNYSYADVIIYGTGIGANARAIISPINGHGYNPAKELGAKNIMITTKFGESDSTEGGLISQNTSFRQYGLLSGPYKYNENTPISFMNANTIISQTFDIIVNPGVVDYEINENIYQGPNLETSFFSGILHDQDKVNNILKLTNVKGVCKKGILIKGESSIATRSVIEIKPPEFQPYMGDILFANNIPKVQRAYGQAENIKFVIDF